MSDIPNNISKFIEELTALTHKYNVKVDGCGCCDSPYVREITAEPYKTYPIIYDTVNGNYQYTF